MNTVNYLLLYRGNSDEGGPESSVRAFSKLESAREAMVKAHRSLAKAVGIPAGPHVFSDPYTTRTKNGIRLDHYSDHFQWEIVEAVPEDGGPGSDLRHGLAKCTVTIEEHVAQEFSVDACDIFHAVQVGKAGYKRGSLVVEPAAPNTRLIMARDPETGETTEWKTF